MGRDYVKKHAVVKQRLEEMIKKCGCGCIPVRDLAKETKMDERTVKAHLDILKIHGVGTYLDNKKRVFCSKKGIKELGKQLGLKVGE